MYSVVKQIKCSFTVFTALFITVITLQVRAFNLTCGPEELDQCSKALSVLTDTGRFVKSKEDFDMLCPHLNESVSCIYAYSRLCMNFRQGMHFRKLFRGTASLVDDICKNGTYQDELLFHAPCMQEVSAETKVCSNNYSEAMSQIQTAINKQTEATHEALKIVCCSYQELVDCTTQAVRKTCGDDAAQFSKGFFDKMGSSMIKINCGMSCID